jgi:hypothetical protein
VNHWLSLLAAWLAAAHMCVLINQASQLMAADLTLARRQSRSGNTCVFVVGRVVGHYGMTLTAGKVGIFAVLKDSTDPPPC